MTSLNFGHCLTPFPNRYAFCYRGLSADVKKHLTPPPRTMTSFMDDPQVQSYLEIRFNAQNTLTSKLYVKPLRSGITKIEVKWKTGMCMQKVVVVGSNPSIV
jgi:hypothetical protein